MRAALCRIALASVVAANVHAADLGSKGGPEPRNIDEIAAVLRSDPYDLELLISYGTSKGGSGGHLALALRDELPDDDLVYSANYYADRTPEHEKDFYTADLHDGDPEEGVPVEDLFVPRRQGVVRPRFR